MKKIVKIAILN